MSPGSTLTTATSRSLSSAAIDGGEWCVTEGRGVVDEQLDPSMPFRGREQPETVARYTHVPGNRDDGDPRRRELFRGRLKLRPVPRHGDEGVPLFREEAREDPAQAAARARDQSDLLDDGWSRIH